MSRLLRRLRVLSILVPALVVGFVGWQDYRATIQSAEQQAEKSIGILHEHALKVFEIYDLVLDQVRARLEGADPNMPAASRRISAFLHKLDATRDEIASIWIVDAGGTPVAASVAWPQGATARDRDYFLAQKAHDAGTYVGRDYIGQATHERSFGVSRRRPSASGEFTGTVHVAVDAGYFERFFRNALPEGQHTAALVRPDGAVLARDPTVTPPPNLPANSATMMHIAAGDRGIFWAVSPVDKVERLIAFRRLGNKPLYVVYGLDESAVLWPWLYRLIVYALIAAGGGLALFTLTEVALRRARNEEALVGQLGEEIARRERMEETVRQAHRLEAVGQLTGGVAHDFNNILTTIIGNLDLIKGRTAPDDARQRLAEAGLQSAHRAARLVQHLLAFARHQRLAPEVLRLNAVITEAEPLYRQSVGETVGLSIDIPRALWPCRLDPAQLDAVMLNLLLNARDAMPEGGRITIAAGNMRIAAGEVPDLAPGDYVLLSVRDTGAGMPPEVLARAFEPFYTTKEVGKGSGLGLSMVYGFVKQSGGTVQIASESGRGTAVGLYLPRALGAPRSEGRDERPRGEAEGSSATVLVVEDQEDVRRVTTEALEEAGYHVLLAGDAREALSILAGRGSVDAMVTDIVMPGGLDGIALAREARERWPGMPVLLVTGYMSEAGLADSQGVAWGVLQKPYRPTELCAKVRQMLDRATRARAG